MSPDDQYNCQSIIAELISENYRKLNVFLLEPNYIDAPNYFSIIERPSWVFVCLSIEIYVLILYLIYILTSLLQQLP